MELYELYVLLDNLSALCSLAYSTQRVPALAALSEWGPVHTTGWCVRDARLCRP